MEVMNYIFTTIAAAADDDVDDDVLMHSCSMHMFAGRKFTYILGMGKFLKMNRI